MNVNKVYEFVKEIRGLMKPIYKDEMLRLIGPEGIELLKSYGLLLEIFDNPGTPDAKLYYKLLKKRGDRVG